MAPWHDFGPDACISLQHGPCLDVIPAKAGIQFALKQEAKMDSRFRGNDVKER
jgi:hypothetical protein